MVGRVVLCLLWFYLQPILLSNFYLSFDPERDTQEFLYVNLYSTVTYLFTVLQPPLHSFFTSLFEAGQAEIITLMLSLHLFVIMALPQHVAKFTRKHGRWKHSTVFPMCFLLLSTASINDDASVMFNIYKLSHRSFSVPHVVQSSTSIGDTATASNFSSQVFNMCVDPECPSDSFFHEDIFDYLPFEDSNQGESVPASLLHLSGYSKEWMSACAKREDYSHHYKIDDSPDSSTPYSVQDIDTLIGPFQSQCHSHVPSNVLHHFQSRLTQGQEVLSSPYAFASVGHLPDTKLYLRSLQLHAQLTDSPRIFPVLIDTGCSVACTGYKEDFNDALVDGDFGQIKTANGTAGIQGFGMVTWNTISEEGQPVQVRVPAYYAPEIELRLFSPQDYARYHKQTFDTYSMIGNSAWFDFLHESATPGKAVIVHTNVDPQSQLFFFYASPTQDFVPKCTNPLHAHVSEIVLDRDNLNLSVAQKRLLLDHQRLGHVRMGLVQSLYTAKQREVPGFLHPDDQPTIQPCLKSIISGQHSCPQPMCATCQLAKARRRTPDTSHRLPNPDTTPSLRVNDLSPGDCVSMDQYESSVGGRLPHTRGREHSRNRYRGGTLFFDHASGKIFVRHQVSLTGSETVASKRSFEREAISQGVYIKSYHTDNGIFKSKEFERSLEEDQQHVKKSGVGAKHQNGLAERAIGIVQNMARAMLLHYRIHWPDEFDPAVWPFAMSYAVWIYNNLPHTDRANFSAEELFSNTYGGLSPLRRARVFGCPAYVLDARLQDGKKIPKWQPRGRTGIFLGFSDQHSSTVGLILNPQTGHISPQFHIVYDERFETVTSDRVIDLSETWIDLWQHSREFYLEAWDPVVDGPYPELDDDFKPDRDDQGEDSDSNSDSDSDSDSDDDYDDRKRIPTVPTIPGWFDVEEAPPRQTQPTQPQPQAPAAPAPTTQNRKISESPQKSTQSDPRNLLESETESITGSEIGRRLQAIDKELEGLESDSDMSDADPEDTGPSPSRTRRGTTFKPHPKASVTFRPVNSRLFSHVRHISNPDNLVYATLNWETVTKDPLYQRFDDLFSLYVDTDTRELLDPDNAIHPFAMASKLESQDYPTFQEILRLSHEERSKWFDSMDEEICTLFKTGACEFADRQEVLRNKKEIVKSTWAFRKKRKPSGEITRYKSRLCVRGDLQKATGSYGPNETFAPVVEWITIRMLFTLGIIEGWSTASIDFASAFTQASLPEPICLELPPGYKEANPEMTSKVIKVKTSLYGDRRAANLWYRKIASTLTDSLGFQYSELDPCLFIRADCILVLYVDDAIIMSRNEESVLKLLDELKQHDYNFSRDGDFKSYLGVQLDTLPDGSLKMSQPHLAQSLVDVTGMQDSSPAHTPSSGPLFRYPESQSFDGSFSYRSAIGILQYLGNNTQPDCSYAINSCARFCIDPKEPHGKAVKRIARYIKDTYSEGIIVKPDMSNLSIDCHVDADFAGNWNLQDADDASGVKSRTGYLLTFGGVPLIWKSVQQTCIALSTMESEYIALSTAMRSLVHVRALMNEICTRFNLNYGDKISTISTVFEDNRAAKILATTDPPRLTPRSKSLAVRYHWFRSHIGIKDGKGIRIVDVQSALNKADFLTKALARDAFQANRLAVSGW